MYRVDTLERFTQVFSFPILKGEAGYSLILGKTMYFKVSVAQEYRSVVPEGVERRNTTEYLALGVDL